MKPDFDQPLDDFSQRIHVLRQENLLDTHTLIWFLNGSKELSKTALQLIETEGAANFVSMASLWEMAIKISLGKLELKVPFPPNCYSNF